ncbi:MAG: helix-turn-helix domain-containing protein [Chloroflexi bacterium]|nr:helix-turn-helix domain-containing protein [Chloroflexota bacterium]
MSELGQRLRNARQSQGISISQAATETRILQRYLEALEDGDYQYLPGDVYARGFIRNYALYLKIPVEELIQLYRYERGRTEPIVIRPAVVPQIIPSTILPQILGVFFVMLTITGLGYLVLRAVEYLDITPAPIVESGADVVATATIAVVAPTTMPEEATATVFVPTAEPTASAPTPTIQASPTPEAPIMLTIQIDSGNNPGSWLHVKVDNKSVYQKILKPGESLRYAAQRDVWIRAGNAYVVTVNINGVEQRLSNTPGDVVSFSWPP